MSILIRLFLGGLSFFALLFFAMLLVWFWPLGVNPGDKMDRGNGLMC